MPITHVFFDIGGVLGSNGWDREQRAHAVTRFGLDAADFDKRHHEIVGEWETGRIGIDEYLDSTVFDVSRDFGRDEFVAFMCAQSEPDAAAIAVARRLAATDRARLFTLNNESATLNEYRIAAFGLRPLFVAFLSSCWLGVRKPSRAIFERALGIAQVRATDVLFVDDREQNLQPARMLGFATHHFQGADGLERALGEHGLL